LSGSGALNLTGNSIANTLFGNTGANIIAGLAGNDFLYGGAGNDRLTGGLNNDYFVFHTALDATTNVDAITDFSVLDDTIRLENAIFTGLGIATGVLAAGAFNFGAAATEADDRIVYNNSTGALIYDSNGSVAGGIVQQFANLSAGLQVQGISAADFVVI
jgi:serralysin